MSALQQSRPGASLPPGYQPRLRGRRSALAKKQVRDRARGALGHVCVTMLTAVSWSLSRTSHLCRVLEPRESTPVSDTRCSCMAVALVKHCGQSLHIVGVAPGMLNLCPVNVTTGATTN